MDSRTSLPFVFKVLRGHNYVFSLVLSLLVKLHFMETCQKFPSILNLSCVHQYTSMLRCKVVSSIDFITRFSKDTSYNMITYHILKEIFHDKLEIVNEMLK